MTFFYKPGDGWAGDVIPFFWQGEYHLFYLKDFRDIPAHGEGTPWYHLSTRDFVTFEDHGEALARGTVDEQDLYVFTGSVIEKDGLFHIFYTGHNPHFRGQGRPEQAVMHAVSEDLHSWRKAPADTFAVPSEGYERHDWRDPFVFWNEETGEYWMLLAARLTEGSPRRRGCTALCVSADLAAWEVRPPLWSPNLYYTHECSDLFKMGDWWYLLFSEFSEATVTRYRMARSSGGPWLTPANDTFDGRAFYAAKTASDGRRRFIFGWNPTRVGERHNGAWQWGGNIVGHEVRQADDGTLTVRMPTSVSGAFAEQAPVVFTAAPDVVVRDATVTINAAHAFRATLVGDLPACCRISMTISFAEHTDSFGLFLHARHDDDAAYFIRFEPSNNRLVLDLWPRPGDVPFMAELERPLPLIPETPLTVEALIDGTVCEIYAGGTVAMSARLYPLPVGSSNQPAEQETPDAKLAGRDPENGNAWGLFVSEGAVTFHDIAVFTR